MNAQKLVGMTQGARKRAAQRNALLILMAQSRRKWYQTDLPGELFHDPACWLYPRRTDAITRLIEYGDVSPELARTQIQIARVEYRIGQRIRPCQGCTACVTQMQDWSVDGAWVEGRAVKHRDGCSHDDPTGYCCFGEIVAVPAKCDGSGVLPAKRSGVAG